MLKPHDPAGIAGPFGHYNHGIEIAAATRWLHVSGQVGVDPDGSVPVGIEAQTARVWENLCAVLAEAGMGPRDIVKTTSYIMDRAHVGVLAELRKRHLGDHKASSTTVLVSGLARPEWLVEIDAVAATA